MARPTNETQEVVLQHAYALLSTMCPKFRLAWITITKWWARLLCCVWCCFWSWLLPRKQLPTLNSSANPCRIANQHSMWQRWPWENRKLPIVGLEDYSVVCWTRRRNLTWKPWRSLLCSHLNGVISSQLRWSSLRLRPEEEVAHGSDLLSTIPFRRIILIS